jgi:hypothetical protein
MRGCSAGAQIGKVRQGMSSGTRVHLAPFASWRLCDFAFLRWKPLLGIVLFTQSLQSLQAQLPRAAQHERLTSWPDT